MTRFQCESIPPAMKGFEFRQRKEKVNWRLLSSIDVDKIITKVDINALQTIIENLSFCDLQSEDLSQTDPTFLKLFQLSQLIIEYLLHSQDFLLENRNKAKAENVELSNLNSQLKATNESQLKLIQELKKEIKAQKKTIYAFQLLSKVPGGAGNSAQVASYYRCEFCPKSFSSSYYLDGHLHRRHAEFIASTQSPIAPPNNVSKDIPRNVTSVTATGTVYDVQKITDTVEQFASRVVETERAFRKDLEDRMDQKMNLEIQRRQNLLEEMYKQERLKSIQEIQELKTALEKELAEEKIAFKEQKNVLETFMKNNRATSHVGRMEDDESDIKSFVTKKVEKHHYPSSLDSSQAKALLELQDRMDKELANVKNLVLQKSSEAPKYQTEYHQQQPSAPVAQPNSLVPETVKKSRVSFEEQTRPPPSVLSEPRTHEILHSTPKSSIKVNSRTNDVWNDIFKKLGQHKNISQSDSPWAKSLYSHDSKLRFLHTKESLVKILQDVLSHEGINEGQVLSLWGQDAVFEKELLDKMAFQILKLEDRSAHDPIYAKMKDFLNNELESGIKQFYQPPNTLLDGFNQIKKAKDPSELRMEILTGKPHQRSKSDNSPLGTKSFAPAIRKHDRIPSNFSFDTIQSKFTKFLRKRQDSGGSSVDSASSPKKFGGLKLKLPFKGFGFTKKRDSNNLASPSSALTDSMVASPISETGSSPLSPLSPFRDDISVQSAETNDLDYSNPNRRIVYSPPDPSLLSPTSPRLETISDVTDVSENEDKSLTVEYESEQNVSDMDSPSPIPPNPISKDRAPIQVVQEISEIKEASPPKILEPLESSPEKSKNSEESFNVSDLSDVSVNAPVASSKEPEVVNFSDEEDSLYQIKEPDLPAKVEIPVKVKAIVLAPPKQEKDLEDLLDELDISDVSDLPKPKIISTAYKPKYDDEFDIDEFEL